MKKQMNSFCKCGKKFLLKPGQVIPNHLPLGHIDDNMTPCSGSGTKATLIRPVLPEESADNR